MKKITKKVFWLVSVLLPIFLFGNAIWEMIKNPIQFINAIIYIGSSLTVFIVVFAFLGFVINWAEHKKKPSIKDLELDNDTLQSQNDILKSKIDNLKKE